MHARVCGYERPTRVSHAARHYYLPPSKQLNQRNTTVVPPTALCQKTFGASSSQAIGKLASIFLLLLSLKPSTNHAHTNSKELKTDIASARLYLSFLSSLLPLPRTRREPPLLPATTTQHRSDIYSIRGPLDTAKAPLLQVLRYASHASLLFRHT